MKSIILQLLEANKPYRITSSTSNVSLGKLAKRNDTLGAQAKSELNRRTKIQQSNAKRAIGDVGRALAGKVGPKKRANAVISAAAGVKHLHPNIIASVLKDAAKDLKAAEAAGVQNKLQKKSKAVTDLKAELKHLSAEKEKLVYKLHKNKTEKIKGLHIDDLDVEEREVAKRYRLSPDEAREKVLERKKLASAQVTKAFDRVRDHYAELEAAQAANANQDREMTIRRAHSHQGFVGSIVSQLATKAKQALARKIGVIDTTRRY